jgi:hypothetical protein
MSLSVIIVNYKTPDLLVNCLRSVYQETKGMSFEVIVVDNNSGDNSKELVLHNFPYVRWIQMDYNAGFARANNEGIKHSTGDIVLLLNSDTVVIDSAIENCYQAFSRSEYVACGVQLLNTDRTYQISGNYFVTGGLNNLLPLPYVGKLIKGLGNLFKLKKPHASDFSQVMEVHWINGAFLMVKKDAINQAGLMDEDFFLYAEEAEWCSRLGKFGKMIIYGQFNVLHLQGESSNQAFGSSGTGYYNLYDRKGLQIMLSNFVRIRKQYGVGWFLIHLLAYTFTIPAFFICGLFEIIFRPGNSKRVPHLFYAFTLNVLRIWRFLVIIIRNKAFFYKVL